jgi:hypothetical protein
MSIVRLSIRFGAVGATYSQDTTDSNRNRPEPQILAVEISPVIHSLTYGRFVVSNEALNPAASGRRPSSKSAPRVRRLGYIYN